MGGGVRRVAMLFNVFKSVSVNHFGIERVPQRVCQQ